MRRVLLLSVLVCTLPALTLAGPSEKIADQVVDEFNTEPRSVRPDHLLLPMSYLEWNGRSYGYHLPRRFHRLAREGETFRIRKTKRRDRAYRIEVESATGARIKLWLYERDDKLSQDLLDQVFPLMLSDLFEFGEAPDTPRVIINTRSGLAHLGACNHLPAPELRMAANDTVGHTPCPACFPDDPPLPYEGYAIIRAAAVERARLYTQAFPPVDDQQVQQRVQELGERLVAALPFAPRGFNYEFTVVQSGLMQAVSYPTGFVFITDKLLAAVEDEAELAHVLAHEIAHCELHLAPAYQPARPETVTLVYYQNQRRTQRRHERVADVVGVTTVAELMDTERALAGATTILGKLQFAHESIPLSEADDWDTHPTLAERRELFEQDNFFVVTERRLFEARDDEGDVLYRLQILGGAHLDNDNQEIFVLVEATDTVNKTAKIGDLYNHQRETGQLKCGSGKSKFLHMHKSTIYIAPSETVVLPAIMDWVGNKDFGISDATHAYEVDPSDVVEIKFFRLPDVDEWVRVGAGS